MELFAKQIRDDLKHLQGLQLFPECKLSPLQRKRYFRSNPKGILKIFQQNL